MKIFLPFTINLDPYLKKLVKEEVQTLEAVAGKVGPHLQLPGQNAVQLPAAVEQLQQSLSGSDQVASVDHSKAGKSNQLQQQLSRHVPAAFARRKLSDLSVESVCALLAALLNGQNGATIPPPHATLVRSNNISGRVLSACDLSELRTLRGLNFGDWNLLRLAILSMRDLEDKGLVETASVETSTDFVGTEAGAPPSRPLLPRRRDSVEKQVELEAEAVSGLLARINETAREDIQLTEAAGRSGMTTQNEDDNLESLFQFEDDAAAATGVDKEEQTEVSQLVYSSRSVPNPEDDRNGRPLFADTRRTSGVGGGGSIVFNDLEREGGGAPKRHNSGSSSRAGSSTAGMPVLRAVNFDVVGERRGSSGPVLVVRNERPREPADDEGSPYAWLSTMAAPTISPGSSRMRYRYLTD